MDNIVEIVDCCFGVATSRDVARYGKPQRRENHHVVVLATLHGNGVPPPFETLDLEADHQQVIIGGGEGGITGGIALRNACPEVNQTNQFGREAGGGHVPLDHTVEALFLVFNELAQCVLDGI